MARRRCGRSQKGGEPSSLLVLCSNRSLVIQLQPSPSIAVTSHLPLASHRSPVDSPPLPPEPAEIVMAPSLARPVTLSSRIVPKTLEDVLDSMDKAPTPQWFYELEQAYQLMPAEEWPRLVEEYEVMSGQTIRLRSSRGKRRPTHARALDAWGGLIRESNAFWDSEEERRLRADTRCPLSQT